MFENYRKDRCYIIAEIGGNFSTPEEAKVLIDAAYDCRVDAVKLQTYRADTITSKKAIFDMENTGIVPQHDLFRKYEVSEKIHKEVFKYAKSKGLDWFSTPSHMSDVKLLERCGADIYKIGSDDAVNLPFLRDLSRTGKPLMLSTGMCTLEEVRISVDAILAEGNSDLMLLHAITSYPTHSEHVNLAAMQTLMKTFPQLDVGYSDHTLSPVACLCAVAMGARIIEKHFTYDKKASGPDHILSADPDEMKWLVREVRNFEIMRGNGIKKPAKSEDITRRNNRKSIVIERSVKKGNRLTETDISIKRPGYGIAPAYFEQIIGRKLVSDMEKDDVLSWGDLG